MKIVFSRKGLDSSFGNFASPILPDNKLCWIPIPENNINKPNLLSYGDVAFMNNSIGNIMNDLSKGKFNNGTHIHLDPDIYKCHRNRKDGWKGAFGQTGAAQSHLENNKVSKGDIFLFFAWFNKVEYDGFRYVYKRRSPDLHIINGWLQISDIINLSSDTEIPDWLHEHPHIIGEKYAVNDTIYIASEKLFLEGEETNLPGTGCFARACDEITLTAEGRTRSVWKLPKWMYPSGGKKPLSYNENIDKWLLKQDCAELRVASRGQEFILDTNYYPEATKWLYELIANQCERKNVIV